MSHGMFNVHLPADLRRAAQNYADDHAVGLGDVIRMHLARALSKEGYFRTNGRGWRRGRKATKDTPPDASTVPCGNAHGVVDGVANTDGVREEP